MAANSRDDQHEARKWLYQFVDWAAKLLIAGTFALLWRLNETINMQQIEITTLKSEVAIIKGQMVGWDVLTRIERTLGLLAATGQGNEAMGAVAGVLRGEREARQK